MSTGASYLLVSLLDLNKDAQQLQPTTQPMAARKNQDLMLGSNWDEDQNVNPESGGILDLQWEYRGEGNANIVIAIKDELRVLRFPKSQKGMESDGWVREREKVEREVKFANEIFRPHLGHEYVSTVFPVRVTLEQIKQLNESLRTIRPKSRLHKELKVPYATAHLDFARIHGPSVSGPEYCVEIKPKQGVWHKSVQDSSLCIYCLNQFLKLKLGKIGSITNYCPLDLFSGEPHRIIHGLLCLIENPQNNLRIFRNGCFVYGDNNNESLYAILCEWMYGTCDTDPLCYSQFTQTKFIFALKNFVYLLSVALVKPRVVKEKTLEGQAFFALRAALKREIEEIGGEVEKFANVFVHQKSHSLRIKTSCSPSASIVPEGGILARLLRVQGLSRRGLFSIYNMYKKVCPVHVKWAGSTCPGEECLESTKVWLDEVQSDFLCEEEFLALEQYLTAATAKDCSLLLTFAASNGGSREVGLNDLNGTFHQLSIGVADLDPKPLNCIVKHYLRDKAMLEAHRKFKNQIPL